MSFGHVRFEKSERHLPRDVEKGGWVHVWLCSSEEMINETMAVGKAEGSHLSINRRE